MFKDIGKVKEVVKLELPNRPRVAFRQKKPNLKDIELHNRDEHEMKGLGWAHLGKSLFTIWHRPTTEQLPKLLDLHKLTTVVTILGYKENPDDIRHACWKLGLNHHFIVMEDANEETLNDEYMCFEFTGEAKKLVALMSENKEKVLIHCGAGIHRSGVITYALLRMAGLNPLESFHVIQGVRVQTAIGVGEWRVRMTEKNIVK